MLAPSGDARARVVREREDRELRVDAEARGEDARVADVEVVRAPHAEPLVDDAFLLVAAHRVPALGMARAERDPARVLDGRREVGERLERAVLLVAPRARHDADGARLESDLGDGA